MFNSRTCQLILGAGALHLVGLKNINTKNLGLSFVSVDRMVVINCRIVTSNLFVEEVYCSLQIYDSPIRICGKLYCLLYNMHGIICGVLLYRSGVSMSAVGCVLSAYASAAL